MNQVKPRCLAERLSGGVYVRLVIDRHGCNIHPAPPLKPKLVAENSTTANLPRLVSRHRSDRTFRSTFPPTVSFVRAIQFLKIEKRVSAMMIARFKMK